MTNTQKAEPSFFMQYIIKARSMKKFLLFLFLSATVALNYAALDDITTGSEPNFYAEYAVIIGSAAIWILLIRKNRRQAPVR